MQIKFSYSKINEYHPIIYNLYNIETGFYRNAGMFLSYNSVKTPQFVIVPKFKTKIIKSIWKKYQLTKKDIPNNYKNYSEDIFPEIYDFINKLPVIDIKNHQNSWNAVQKSFAKIINSIFINDLDIVNVYLSRYGTVASYNHSGKDLYIYLRDDADISQVAFCILSYFIHKHKTRMNWTEEQRIADFILLDTRMANLFPSFVSILDQTQKEEIDLKLLNNSNDIYKDLGITLESSIEHVDGEYLINKEVFSGFTKQEQIVLDTLLINKNKITTSDQISIALWGENYSSFSLQAISKIVERLRAKIYSAGINRQVIYTKRKLGYILID